MLSLQRNVESDGARQFDYDHEHDYEQELASVEVAWPAHSITNYEHEHEDIEKYNDAARCE